MKIIKKNNVPIFSWCDNPESSAIDQASNLANLPFIYKHVCLMPDTHMGYGMPIGGVIACDGIIVPNAVGVDIGCGIATVKTSLTSINPDSLKGIMGEIRKKIPVGFNKHKEQQDESLMPRIKYDLIGNGGFTFDELPVCSENYSNARKQLGTLGGGNHFIEIQKGDDGHIWFMVHSGSRNLGKQVCDHYNKLATEHNKTWLNYTKDLAFLPLNHELGKKYINEMNYALEFAKANRQVMVDKIKESFDLIIPGLTYEDEINIHHNYAAMEHHFGKNVMVHRKGATRARKGELGIIPGSQGTCSYIVRGLGNELSFTSCSHGAGRKLSRKKAKENLSVEDESKLLNDKGIIHSIRNVGDLDEAPGAYKDIDIVMEEQKDLVEIMAKLEPLGVIKG